MTWIAGGGETHHERRPSRRCMAKLMLPVRCTAQAFFIYKEMWQQRCELMSCTAGAVQGQHKRERAREQRKQRARARWLQDAVCGITLLPPCFLKGVGYLHRPIMEKNSPAARSQSRFSQGSGAARPESATPPSASTPVTRGRGVDTPGAPWCAR